MKNRKKLVSIFLSLLLFAGCVEYMITPGAVTVASNNNFTVDISLHHCIGPFPFTGWYFCTDTSDVYGVGFDLNYDPSRISFQSIDAASGVLHDVTAVTGFRNSLTDNGKLVVAVTKSGQVSGEPGEGKVATITFRALSAGATDLTFVDPHLVDSQGKFLVGWPFYWAQLSEASVSITP